MLVSLARFGVNASVNPQYVTAVEPKTFTSYRTDEPPSTPGVEVWVQGHAGYGTFSIALKGVDAQTVTDHLNQPSDEAVAYVAELNSLTQAIKGFGKTFSTSVHEHACQLRYVGYNNR